MGSMGASSANRLLTSFSGEGLMGVARAFKRRFFPGRFASSRIRMSSSTLMTGFRLVVVLAMMIGGVPFVSHTASLHNPEILQAIERVRHASLVDGTVDGDHVHHDGLAEERQPGHSHADHSHEQTGFAVAFAEPGCAKGAASPSEPPRNIYSEPLFRFDRPPRHGFPT
jgi:hypothetical protein